MRTPIQQGSLVQISGSGHVDSLVPQDLEKSINDMQRTMMSDEEMNARIVSQLMAKEVQLPAISHLEDFEKVIDRIKHKEADVMGSIRVSRDEVCRILDCTLEHGSELLQWAHQHGFLKKPDNGRWWLYKGLAESKSPAADYLRKRQREEGFAAKIIGVATERNGSDMKVDIEVQLPPQSQLNVNMRF